MTHPWDEIKKRSTTISMDFLREMGGSGIHESLFRSYAILREVEAMLVRNDSPETIRTFVEWATSRPVDE